MLLPTQQSLGLVATTAMRSMLDGIEEQRRQEEEQQSGKERDMLTEAKISASEEAKRARDKIASALFGTGNDSAALKMDLIERLAKNLGIDMDEARSSYTLGKTLEDALKSMGPDQVADLAEKIGLSDLGVSMNTLLNAIKNPYGDDNERLNEAFIRKANGGTLGTEVERVVQRLEAVADPKSLEELKLGPQGYDPTQVEDAETRAERQSDIQAAEAGQKLEDIEKTQDAVEGQLGAEAGQARSDANATLDNDATATLTVLAAAAEQVTEADFDTAIPITSDGTAELTQIDKAQAQATLEDAIQDGELGETILDSLMADQVSSATYAIVPVRQDELGIYEILKSRRAA